MVRLLCDGGGTDVPQSEALSEGSATRDGATSRLVSVLVVDRGGRSLCLVLGIGPGRRLLCLLGMVMRLLRGLLRLLLVLVLPLLLMLLPARQFVAIHMSLVLHGVACVSRLS